MSVSQLSFWRVFQLLTLFLTGFTHYLYAEPLVEPASPSPTEDQPYSLPPVTVTAQRAEQIAQDVPLSMTVFDAPALDDASLQHTSDLAALTPNLGWVLIAAKMYNIFTLRGQGGSLFADPSVGVYVDGVSYPSRFHELELLDLERVEVLRGPQGTLYGRNTIGGAINFITRQPSDTPQAELRTTFGNQGLFRDSVRLSGPLLPGKLFAAFSGRFEKRDGLVRSPFLAGTVEDTENLAGRFQLRFLPTDTLELRLSLDMGRDRDDPNLTLPFDDFKDYRSSVDVRGAVERDTQGGALSLIYTTPAWSLTSISAFRIFDDTFSNDYDGIDLLGNVGFERHRDRQFSQEIRIASPVQGDRLSWLGGVYILIDDSDFFIDENVPSFGILRQTNTQRDTQSYAVFGQLSYELSDGLIATAGLRYTREHKRFRSDQAGLSFGEPGAFQIRRTEWFNAWTPRFSLTYHWTDSLMSYASVSRGFKGAGFNRIPLGATDTGIDPEFSWSYEVGWKSQWFQNHLQLNTSLFYTTIEHQQVVFAGIGFIGLRNATASTSRGFEVEAAARPLPGLDLTASFGYIDTHFDKYRVSDVDLSGNHFAAIPDYDLALTAQYRRYVQQLGTLFGRVAYHRLGRQYFDDINTLKQNAYGLVHLRFGLERERFDIYGFIDNVADKHYRAFGFTALQRYATAGTERHYGFEVRVRF